MIALLSGSVSFNRPRSVAVSLISVFLLALSGCGSDDTTTSPGASVVLRCENDFDEIVELLRSGSPTYDYNPATDLPDLLQRTDVAMTGTIDSLVRTVAEPNEAGDDSWTTVSSADAKILGHSADSSGAVFSRSSVWALRAEPDPLSSPVAVAGVAFVAFLHVSSGVPGGFLVDVQGFFVSCAGSTSPAAPVIERLPNDARNLSIDELTAAVFEAVEAG